MRLRARVDANQKLITAALRAVGAEVQPIHQLSHGVPDLMVCYRGQIYLMEVKDGDKPPSQRKLTADEASWHARWPVQVVETIADALRAIGLEVQ